MLSFVFVAHNQADKIKPSLGSLLAQTDAPRFEVVVVNDGSTDGTAAELGTFTNDPRVRLIHLPVTQGFTRAGNVGFDASHGEACCLLSPDCMVQPNYARQLAAGLADSAVSYCSWDEKLPSGETVQHRYQAGQLSPHAIYWGRLAMPYPAFAFKRQQLGDLKFGMADWAGLNCADDYSRELLMHGALRSLSARYCDGPLFVRTLNYERTTCDYDDTDQVAALSMAAFRRRYACGDWWLGKNHWVDVVIPAHNGHKLTIACIESIWNYSGVPARIVYVDDGSDDESLTTVENLLGDPTRNRSVLAHDDIVIGNKGRCGWTEAVNRGLRSADAPAVFLANNDIQLGPGCLELLWSQLHGDVAAAGAITDEPGGYDYIFQMPPVSAAFESPAAARSMPLETVAARLRKADRILHRNMVAFSAALVPRYMLEAIKEKNGGNYFDPAFPGGIGADDWWGHQAMQMGKRLVTVCNAFCRHTGGATFAALNQDRAAMVAESRRMLRERGVAA